MISLDLRFYKNRKKNLFNSKSWGKNWKKIFYYLDFLFDRLIGIFHRNFQFEFCILLHNRNGIFKRVYKNLKSLLNSTPDFPSRKSSRQLESRLTRLFNFYQVRINLFFSSRAATISESSCLPVSFPAFLPVTMDPVREKGLQDYRKKLLEHAEVEGRLKESNVKFIFSLLPKKILLKNFFTLFQYP